MEMGWDQLPQTVWPGVSAGLSNGDLCNVRLTCITWNFALEDPLVWEDREVATGQRGMLPAHGRHVSVPNGDKFLPDDLRGLQSRLVVLPKLKSITIWCSAGQFFSQLEATKFLETLPDSVVELHLHCWVALDLVRRLPPKLSCLELMTCPDWAERDFNKVTQVLKPLPLTRLRLTAPFIHPDDARLLLFAFPQLDFGDFQPPKRTTYRRNSLP